MYSPFYCPKFYYKLREAYFNHCARRQGRLVPDSELRLVVRWEQPLLSQVLELLLGAHCDRGVGADEVAAHLQLHTFVCLVQADGLLHRFV